MTHDLEELPEVVALLDDVEERLNELLTRATNTAKDADIDPNDFIATMVAIMMSRAARYAHAGNMPLKGFKKISEIMWKRTEDIPCD